MSKTLTGSLNLASTPGQSLGSTSRFRNLFGNVLNNRAYEGLNVSLTVGSNLLRTNGVHYAVPWARSKGIISQYLAVFPVDAPGKVDPKPLCVNTGAQQVVDFDFYPFQDGIIATCGRDAIVKVWNRPRWELITDLEAASCYLAGHEKKIDILKFNPTVADLLLTCSSDLSMKLWDFRKMAEIQTIEGFDDVVMSAAWSYSGNLILTATRDGMLRYYDPRHNSAPAGEVKTDHSPAKGINVTFLGDTELLSTGFSKTGDREIYVWDARKLSEPLNTTSCGVKPGVLTPFFDATIGLLYVAAKGEGISVYEYSDTKSFTPVSEVKTERPQTAVALLPKYQNDMENCEVARFLKLSNDNYIQTVSIRVPRKTKATLFQEDLYPPTPSNEPGLTMENWGKGKKAAPKLLNLKPPNAVSVYDVPPEEGGIQRPTKLVQQEEKKKGLAKGKEGFLYVLNKGYLWSTWEKKWTWTSGKRLYHGDSKDTVTSSQSTSLAGLVRVVVIGVSTDPAQLTFDLDFGTQTISLKGEDTKSRDEWVKEIAEITGTVVHSENPFVHKEVPESPLVVSGHLYQGLLQFYSEGFWGRAKWTDRYVVLEEGTLSVFADEKSFTLDSREPIESLRLHQIISVRLTDVNASYGPSPEILDNMVVFQINIPNRVIYLRSPDAQSAMIWVMTIQEAAARAIKKTSNVFAHVEIHEIYERFSFSVEGYLLRKVDGEYEKVYLSVLGGDFFYFKTHFGLYPIAHFKGANVESVSSVDVDDKFCLRVVISGKEHIHAAASDRVRGWWVRKLTKIQEAQFNLYEKMEIDALLANKVAFEKMERYSETRMIDSGAIKNGTQPILIQITGKRNAYAELVPLAGKSLNKDSVYILDAGSTIYQWNGAQTSRVCQARGADIANRIRKQERGGNANIVSVNDAAGNQISPFLKLLGFKNSADLAACDNIAGEASDEKGSRKSVIVLKITNSADTKKRIQFVFNDDERLPSKELLLTEHAYVIDAESEIYVWIGSNSGQNERKLAMIIAKRLLCEADRVPWTTITKVLENTETVMFKEKFSDYPGELPVHVQPIDNIPSNIAPKMEQPPISIAEMHKERVLEEEIFDNGKGELTMWLVVQRVRQSGVKEWEKELLGEEYHGHLFTGESFIFQYKYIHKNVEKFVIYFWQGRDSSISEKGASALESIDVANDTGGEARQVRIPQGHETQHFLSLFREALVIHLGKFRAAPRATQFYQVREKHKSLVAMEVDDPELCLNSDFMSFVIAKKKPYFWFGKFCSELERGYKGLTMFDDAQMAACVKIEEGNETPEFLKVIAVDNQKVTLEPAKKKTPPVRVFLVSGSSGIIVVEEVPNCTQDDLDNEHVMIVDGFSQVFVWFGDKATSAEKELALDTAKRYVAESPRGHRSTTPLRVTYPFYEPRAFMKYFHGWTFTKLPPGKVKGAEKSYPLEMVLENFQRKTYSFELLTSDKVPEHLDRTKLETYLSDEDFEKIFGMTREHYDRLPEWKKTILRKEKRLY